MSASHILGMPEMPLQAAAPGSYDGRRKQRGNGYARSNIDIGRSVMDRRAFLQSGSLAAAAGAAIANAVTPAAAETPGAGAAAHARDWSNRRPKGAPVVKRFDEQRWVLDNVIQANGIDWDQGRTAATLRGLGPGAAPDMDELRKRVKRLVDICPAFETLAGKREAMAKDGRASRRQGRGPRQLFHGRQLLGLGDVDHRRGQPEAHELERQETRGLRQIHGARRPSHRMGRAALSRQIAAGDFSSAAQLPKRRQGAGDRGRLGHGRLQGTLGRALQGCLDGARLCGAGVRGPGLLGAAAARHLCRRAGLGGIRQDRRRLARQAAGDRCRQDRHDRRQLRLVLHRDHDGGGLPATKPAR